MQMTRRCFIGAAACWAATPALAQAPYPARPIRLVVPYPAGGGTDFFARLVGHEMEKALGQPIVVENRAGAGTIVGAEAVARSPADGYTLLLGDVGTYAANPSLHKKLSYDPAKDFAPITLTGRFAVVLVVNTQKLNAGTLQELVELARKEPGAVVYGSGGIGNPFHLASEWLAQAAGIKLTHVAYRGAAPAVQDLTAGHIGMMFLDFATARSQLGLPGIKAIAVASASEFAGLPGVPTVGASYPGFEVWAWQGLVAPSGTPPEIVEKIRASYVSAISDPAIKAKLTEAGIDVAQSTPAEFADYRRTETDKWARIIKTGGISVD
jgi:tripartite-type tricarboxylate transporter receptor subunit TctC